MRKPIQLHGPRLAAAICILLPLHGAFGQTAVPVQTPQPIRMGLIAIDRFNHAVEDLRQEEVQVSEDGQPRPITFFARDVRPLRYTIALDVSGSFKSLLPTCLSVVRGLIENNRPNDETMIVSFVGSDNIERVHDFTTDKSKLLDSIKVVAPEGGHTAVIDAVHLSVDATASNEGDNADVRRVVVLISDGEDRSSYYTQNQLLKLLREKDVQIFIIGIVTQLEKEGSFIRPNPREKAKNLLNTLAQETGGLVFFPKNLAELREAAQEVNKNLGSQYIIGFERQDKIGEKGFRKVKVSIVRAGAEKLTAITRPGYWAGPRDPARKDKK